eukprot:scaffold29582_cov42-Prasinocladus_malaysianus.AAC.1
MVLGRVFRRVTSCFAEPVQPDASRDLSVLEDGNNDEVSATFFGQPEPRGLPGSPTAAAESNFVRPNARMESVDRRALRPPGHLSYLKPAKHNP